MPISVVARGRVAEGPFSISSDDGPLVAFVFGDAQIGLYQGRQIPIEDLSCCEVLCRGKLATHAMEHLTRHQRIVVTGHVRISQPLDEYDDRQLVHVAIEAGAIGTDIAHMDLNEEGQGLEAAASTG